MSKSPNKTLQREYQTARLQPRHLVPVPPALRIDTAPAASADAPAVEAALSSALRLMDLYRQLSAPCVDHKQLLLLSRRITRIRSLFAKLKLGPAGEK